MKQLLNRYVNKFRIYAFVLAVALLVTVFGCAVEKAALYEKDGKVYGRTGGIFKSQWDDYYLRGLSYMEGDYWEDAVRDFEKAIHKRSKDQRRARTYGLHFIDYFPNRELGIACYHLGRYSEALDFLEQSMSSAETARTKFYLNKAREAWLKKNGLDHQPPDVSVQFPPKRHVTSDLSVPLKVRASDNYFVSGIVVNGSERSFELSSKKKQFEDEYFLKNGRNIITVQSRDILGKTSRPVTVEVCLDRQGPLLILGTEPSVDGVRIKAVFYDASGLKTAKINNQVLEAENRKSCFADITVRPGAPVVFRAEDMAGNVTAGSAMLKGAKTAQGFELFLPGVENGQTVFADSVPLQAELYLTENLKEVVVNGYPVSFDRDPDLSALLRPFEPGVMKYMAFSRRLQLHDGSNRIRVTAQDITGKDAGRTLHLFKKKQAVRQLSARMSLAILPFSGEDSDDVAAVLLTAFKAQERFNVLTPDRVQAAVREKGANAGLDLQSAAKLGAFLGADAVMTGEILRTNRSVEISGRFVDSETGNVLAEKDVYFEGSSYAGLRCKIDFLARKFKKHFPLCETRVVESLTDRVMIGAGEMQAVKAGMKFLSYRVTDEGFPGSDSTVSGLLQAEGTEKTASACRVLKQTVDSGIRTNDRVIAK